MTDKTDLQGFAATLSGFMEVCNTRTSGALLAQARAEGTEGEFNRMALELFGLQFKHNPAYRNLCEARQIMPGTVTDWRQIPSVPTAAFKEFELSCLPPAKRSKVFCSSGTTETRPSRHFHNDDSLLLYEQSVLIWFSGVQPPDIAGFVSLTPDKAAA